MKVAAVAALVLVVLALAAACGSGSGGVQPPPPAPPPSGGNGTDAPTPERGKSLASERGCTACHSVDGNVSVGPTWKGLYGKEKMLTGGVKVKVDEAYLRESIVTPNAKVVEGFFPGVMPQDFGARLSQQEIQSLLEYIKSLQ